MNGCGPDMSLYLKKLPQKTDVLMDVNFFFSKEHESVVVWLNENLVFGGINFMFMNGFEVSQAWLSFLFLQIFSGGL